jgi:hypothetical protein
MRLLSLLCPTSDCGIQEVIDGQLDQGRINASENGQENCDSLSIV